MAYIGRRIASLPPRGIIRPSQREIDGGLSFAMAFQNGPAAPWLARGGLPAATLALQGAAATIGVLSGGHGLTGNGGWWGSTDAANTYAPSTTAGTVIVAFVADHASNAAGNRIMLSFGNAGSFPTNPGIAISNFGGAWVAGWADGGDRRISVSATGLYVDGSINVAALTWDATGQASYLNGTLLGTAAAAAYASTAGADFKLGNYASFPWISSSRGGILFARVIDRAMPAAEIREQATDLWGWVDRPKLRLGRRPAVASTIDLEAESVATGAPTVGAPALGQVHALAAASVATAAPTVGAPALAQIHALQATSSATGAPTVGTPALGQAHALTAANVATGAPVVGSPAIGQTHVLAAASVATGAPTVGTPSLGQSGALEAESVATGAPTVGTPALGQTHVLAAAGVATGAPVVGAPTLAQVHALLAGGIATGAPTVGVPALNAQIAPVPPSRTYRVPAAPRRHALAAEPRTYRLRAEPRRYTVPPEA